jgi:hypothetical protein
LETLARFSGAPPERFEEDPMSMLAQLANDPEWLVAEMPPGYQNRVAEIQRLTEDLRTMGRFGRLLCQVGPELTEAVRDTFAVLRFDVDEMPDASALTVRLDSRRRLLLYVSAATGAIQKKGPELAQVFRLVQELADDGDRVVLLGNSDPNTRPADRVTPVGPEAQDLLRRLGANFLAAPTLFSMWSLSLHDMDRARAWVERLYSQDGGMFVL